MKSQVFQMLPRAPRIVCLSAAVLSLSATGALSALILPPPHSGMAAHSSAVRAVSHTPDLTPRLPAHDACRDRLTPSPAHIAPGAGPAFLPADNPAGRAAALSLALGIRFATGPLESPGAPVPMRAESSATPDGAVPVTVQSITAYRNCKKEQALRARQGTMQSS